VPSFPATPGYWLLHAAEAKFRADELSDSELKWTMLLIARGMRSWRNICCPTWTN